MADDLQFKISSSLKNIIGRDLITDDFIAVFELVKNSYDAHANKVIIRFEKDKITIQDNGKGMSLNDIKEKWLFVAYSAKKEGVEDDDIFKDKKYRDYRNKIDSKKYYAGAKGIGRFSCDRLGQYLTLYTKKVNHQLVEKLDIKWREFEEDSKKEFINIKVQHETLNKISISKFSHGTILEISGLHSIWTRKKMLQLKHSLEKLINPFGTSKEAAKFKIIFEAPNEVDKDASINNVRQKVNGQVKSFLFEKLNVKTTQILTTINNKIITSELIDRGTSIFKISEKNTEYSCLSDVRFNLFYLNRAAKNNFTRTMGLRPVKFGSVFLFKNGFRIYPYGDEGDDTLRIDRRKQQGHSRYLGTRDLIGRIEIFGDGEVFSELFNEASSRDSGLMETEGYHELVDAFYDKCLKRLEKYVVGIQWKLKLTDDKDREDTSVYEYDTKRKIIEIIYTLVNNDDVELISFNKDFLNIIGDKIDEDFSEVFDQLTKIAKETDDKSFEKELVKAKNKFLKLKREKEKAEERAAKAEEKRFQAEKEKKEEEIKRQEEEKKRKEAELKFKQEEQLRKEAELKKKEAELKKREAQIKAAEEKEKRITVERHLEVEQSKNTYLLTTSRGLSRDAESLVHSIKLVSDNINTNLDLVIRKIRENKFSPESLLQDISIIKRENEKALKISEIITRANFKTDIQKDTVNLPKYTLEYFEFLKEVHKKIDFVVDNQAGDFWLHISILEISIIIDDLISNSKKAKADKIELVLLKKGERTLELLFSDNGIGVLIKYLDNPEKIFELGVTETKGSGIGLYSVKESIEKMRGSISFVGNGVRLKGATFRLIFTK